ncbi:AraC family transcriptional regulator [Paenibacillus senegalensis]|uniref:AraC family transcriptional regulator n=1 Tax=Paenibacillus senegalensis TaxID=1465766 RepID=UPI000288149C|nr:AraC family transcriptional regulator [Paenibacillus senegalensis]
MSNPVEFSGHWADSLFRLRGVRKHSADTQSYRQLPAQLSLLVFVQSSGQIRINSQSYDLRSRQLWVVPGGARVELELNDSQPFYYDIRFEALFAEAQGEDYTPVHLEEPIQLNDWNERLLTGAIAEIGRLLDDGGTWNVMRANVRFQELLINVLEQDEIKRQADIRQNLKRTVDYMKKHLSEPVTRDELAAMAGLNPDYYTRVFKKLYNQTPLAYFSDLRIRQAKRRIIQSDEPVRSIALSLGFHDEFYFSRKFKKATGAAPTVYVNRIRQEGKIASLNHLVTGHLLALDTKPYAAVINDAFPVASALLPNTLTLGQSGSELERLRETRPDLILVQGRRDASPASGDPLMDQIAPTFLMEYTEGWRTHLQKIARIIGKQHAADQWLDRYDDRVVKVRRRLQRKLGQERVLIVGIGVHNDIYLFGKRNIGDVLYEDLQFAVPEGVAEIAHYKEVTAEELFRYDTDRILIFSFQHDGSRCADLAMYEQARRLLQSEAFRKHCEQGDIKVHNLLHARHLYTSYNAMSHQLLLQKAYEVFGMDN